MNAGESPQLSAEMRKRRNFTLIIVFTAIALTIYGSIKLTDAMDKEPEKTMHVFEIGQPFTIDRVQFTVHDISREAEGEIQRVSVKYSVKNNGQKEISLSSNNVHLIDFLDRIHESEYSSTPGSMNPGVSKDGVVEFEVPSAIGKSYIGFRADWLDFGDATYGYVQIP